MTTAEMNEIAEDWAVHSKEDDASLMIGSLWDIAAEICQRLEDLTAAVREAKG